MVNFFKYVAIPQNQSVALRLFRAPDGNPQGDVSGPLLGYADAAFSDVVEVVRCSSLEDAFAAGIRMANKNDTDLVISGSPELWLSKWGELDQSAVAQIALPVDATENGIRLARRG